MVIEGTSLHTCHREDQWRVLLMLLLCLDFGEIKRSETGIEMKLQLDAVTGLAIRQSGKLLGIAKQKFNLKAQRV